jgi:ribose transport system ATP-binding protein
MADRVVGLRDGKNAGSLDRNQISHDSLIKLMVGREIKPPSHSEQVVTSSKAVLRLEDLRYAQSPLPGISLEVKSGEILGMAGLMGAGRTELSECVFGLRKRVGGKVILNGSELPANDVRSSIKQGMALVPEDRRGHGLLLETGVGYNLSLPNLDWLNWFGVVRPGSERRMVGEQIKNMGVKTTNASKPVGMLSGGNQQKVVLGKWLARQPKLLILDEPTRGVDVGAREEIYRIMRALAANGIGILMISSDMEEVLSVSDRILVMHEGALSGELHRNQFSEEAVMSLATGKPAEEKTADHIGYGRG